MSGVYENVPATPEEVQAFASTLTDAYLHCRVWGHDPEPHDIRIAKDIEGVPGAHWDVTLLCTHECGVRWTALVSAEGTLLKRKLDYSEAPGYLCESGRIDAEGKKVLRKTYFVGATTKAGRMKKKVR